ncbi:MAG: response regulator [Thermoplasmatota archaeon]
MTSPLRILVVEDNPGDVRLVQETLKQDQRWPFELVAEGRLADGLARLRTERFDLVLLDLGLPDAKGLQAFEDVQGAAPAIPVVVLTGSDDQDVAVQAIHEGAQDYLVKGLVDGDRLWRAIRYGIERKKSEEAQRIAYERLGQIEMLKV